MYDGRQRLLDWMRIGIIASLMAACTSVFQGAESTPDEGTASQIVHWTCPMHPEVQEAGQTPCPLCKMDLTPVTRAELDSGAVVVDSIRRQKFGIRTISAQPRTLTRSIRSLGTIAWDDRDTYDLTIRAMGWVHQLRVHETGTKIKRGDAIAEVYSPDLYNAQRELLAHIGSQRAEEKKDRLELLGLSTSQISTLMTRGVAKEIIDLRSPVTGVVVELNAVKGTHLMEGALLARIAKTERVWVEASIHENDAPWIQEGTPLQVVLPATGQTLETPISRIEPWVDSQTRRLKIRAELDNSEGHLLGNGTVDVRLQAPLGDALAVPVEAVLYTGERRIVFVDEGQDRLVPREVQLGARGDDWVAVREGLKDGESVVTSGVFLVAAESRLRAAQTYWGSPHEQP